MSGVSVFASDHEEVVFCHDRPSGLRAIIAVHSTALGPSLGGTRFHPYASEEEALLDVLNLSRGMTCKNAMAGRDHGGRSSDDTGRGRRADDIDAHRSRPGARQHDAHGQRDSGDAASE